MSGGGGELEGGGSGDPTTGAAINPNLAFWQIAPAWLQDIAPTLKAFGRHPFMFVLGIVFSAILAGIEVVAETFLGAIRFVFVGSVAGSTSGQFGLEDVFLFPLELLLDLGRVVGFAFLDVLAIPGEVAVQLAEGAGPAAPLVLVAGAAVYMLILAVFLRLLIVVAADFIPGLGGVIG